MASAPLTVLLLSRLDPREWKRYFPTAEPRWGRCRFCFDPATPAYDWLVVLDDVPTGAAGLCQALVAPLRCPLHHTVLVTTEPESIKAYGRVFAAQFGHVLTSQPAWALPHPRRWYRAAANHWFYGRVTTAGGAPIWRSRGALERGPAAADKAATVSVMATAKRQWFTNHAQRYAFLQEVQALMPSLQVYGRGAIPAPDKAAALDPCRYHLAIENHLAPHHITEKLTDAFLGRCLPFYAGAPNAADYFPADSFIPISLHDPREAVALMRQAIAADAWQARRGAIEEARRRVLEQEQLFAVLSRLIERAETDAVAAGPGLERPTTVAQPMAAGGSSVLLGRHAWRRRHPVGALLLAFEKLLVRARAIVGKRRARP